MPTVRLSLICAASALLAGLLPQVATADTLLGNWVLNQELSRELQGSQQQEELIPGIQQYPLGDCA